MEKRRVLVLLAHPALEKSRVNGPMAQAALGVEGVVVFDLYEAYPEFFIDKAAEQERVSAHDVIVFQHPLYWYSVPALLKEWLDIVLEHGFAYGPGGTALAGRVLINAWSAGSSREEIELPGATDRITQLMRPFEHTAAYCGMRYLPPLTVFDTGALTHDRVQRHCERYRRLLASLTDPDFLARDFASFHRMNDALETDADG